MQYLNSRYLLLTIIFVYSQSFDKPYLNFMLFQIKSYLQFFWHSKNEHAVHSPFVFSLLTKCFYDKKTKPEYAILKKYRNSLLQNKETIEVTDFGAGSKVFKSNTREISKIAKTAGISPKERNYYSESLIICSLQLFWK